MLIKKIIKVIKKGPIGKTEPYKFMAFLYGQYRMNSSDIYKKDNFAKFEEGVHIDLGVNITHPENVVLKKFSVINRGTHINSCGGFYLGKYSGISYNCMIFTVDHKFYGSKAIPFDNTELLKPVYIEDFVMIGANVCIIPGVRIGEGAIIGMGSVINKDVPPLAIVMGNPWKLIGNRDREKYRRLKEKKAFQSPIIEKYENEIPLRYKRKYEDFLLSIGKLCRSKK